MWEADHESMWETFSDKSEEESPQNDRNSKCFGD